MLLRAIFENFLSFREPVQFDMFPNPKHSMHEHHVYTHDIPVLKVAAIYGANGSGKSNLIKGLNFIHDFVSNNDFYKETEVSDYIHKGNPDSKPEHLNALIEFETADEYYIYSFTLSEDRVISEHLYLSGKGVQAHTPIFKRELDRIEVGDTVDTKVQEAIDKLLLKNPSVSLLQLNEQFPIIENEHVHTASQWLQKDLVIVPFNAVAIKLIDQMDNNPELLQFTKDIIAKIDLGLSDINIKEELFETWIKNKSHRHFSSISPEIDANSVLGVTRENRQQFIAKKDNDQTIIKEFVFSHAGCQGKKFDMNINAESDGTVRLLNLIPALYDAIQLNRTIVVDEIDHSIHPILIFALIKFFADKGTKGQLVFTTHETCLLNQKTLLRPDEVWFTEKIEGATKIYSLNDFKEHNTISIENGYINGRYGAIPYIGEIEWLQ